MLQSYSEYNPSSWLWSTRPYHILTRFSPNSLTSCHVSLLLSHYIPNILAFFLTHEQARLILTLGHFHFLVSLFGMSAQRSSYSYFLPIIQVSVNVTFSNWYSLNNLSKVMPLLFYHIVVFYFLLDIYHDLKSLLFYAWILCVYCRSPLRVKILTIFSPLYPCLRTWTMYNTYVLSEWICMQMNDYIHCPKVIPYGLMWRRKYFHWKG